jgi:hypothetical protein
MTAEKTVRGALAQRIQTAYEKTAGSMIQGLVYADDKQIGKTVYCLKTSKQLYGTWDEVFKHFFFKVDHFCDFALDLAMRKVKVPLLVWDDAGFHAGSELWFYNRPAYWRLAKVIQTLGTVTQALLVNAPGLNDPTGALIANRNLTIKITKLSSGSMRVAKGYASTTYPWGKKRELGDFEDVFNVMLPNQIYARYLALRRDMVIEGLETFKKVAAKGGGKT